MSLDKNTIEKHFTENSTHNRYFCLFQIEEGTFNFTLCEKKCRSKSGLTRHINTVHKSDQDPRDPDDANKPNEPTEQPLKQITFSEESISLHLKSCIQKVQESDLYTTEMKNANFSVSPEQLKNLTRSINKFKVKLTEKFYTKFYVNIVTSADTFVTCTDSSSSILMLMFFIDPLNCV